MLLSIVFCLEVLQVKLVFHHFFLAVQLQESELVVFFDALHVLVGLFHLLLSLGNLTLEP